MSKHTSTDIATRYLQDDESLASVNNRRIHALAKEIDQYAKEQNAEMLGALKGSLQEIEAFYKHVQLSWPENRLKEIRTAMMNSRNAIAKAEGGNP